MPMSKEDLQEKSRRGSVLLVAEGDSWFNFPLHSNAVSAMRRLGYAVKEVADPAHTLEFMATSPHQKDEFSDKLRKLATRRTRPTAVLLSGGGNDFVDVLPLLLNDYSPRTPTLNQSEVDNFSENHLRKHYLEWLNFVTNICDDIFGSDKRIPILIHGYAYAVPDGRRNFFAGPWLKKELKAKGHMNLTQNTQTIAALINSFNDVLSLIPGTTNLDHVHYVNLRKTLSNDLSRANGKRKYKRDWRDELHPTEDGFAKVAAEFSSVIEGL